jgi:hypothetical protein
LLLALQPLTRSKLLVTFSDLFGASETLKFSLMDFVDFRLPTSCVGRPSIKAREGRHRKQEKFTHLLNPPITHDEPPPCPRLRHSSLAIRYTKFKSVVCNTLSLLIKHEKSYRVSLQAFSALLLLKTSSHRVSHWLYRHGHPL